MNTAITNISFGGQLKTPNITAALGLKKDKLMQSCLYVGGEIYPLITHVNIPKLLFFKRGNNCFLSQTKKECSSKKC